MTKTQRFIKNVFILTATSLIMRSISIYYNIYLKGKLGSEGIGLFTLISSVYSFSVTLATSGINLAVAKLSAEAIGKGRPEEIRKVMHRSIIYSLFFGFLSSILLFFLSPSISLFLLDDKRCILSLRALSLSLPFLSLSSALSGYFTAVRRVSKSAFSQFFEEGARVATTSAIFTFLAPSRLEYMCLAVVMGSISANLISFLSLLLLYLSDRRKHIKPCNHKCANMGKRLALIALPVAISAYFRSGLVSVEHILISKGLKKYSASSAVALSSYAKVHAMALPIILFPYAFLAPFSSMIVPEIAERCAASDSEGARRVTEKALRSVCIFSVGCSSFMICASSLLGSTLYSSNDVSFYIRLIAPLIPIMYLDTCTDAILKGCGEQLYSMKINIFDSSLSVLFAYLLVPILGINGYILGIFVCEIVNMALSFVRMHNVIKPSLKKALPLLLPLLSGAASGFLSSLILKRLSFLRDGTLLVLHIVIFSLIYFSILVLSGVVDRRAIISTAFERGGLHTDKAKYAKNKKRTSLTVRSFENA